MAFRGYDFSGKRDEDDIRTCPICGKAFEPKARNQKYCGRKCKQQRGKGGKDARGPI